MLRAYKYRTYPTEEQKQFIRQNAGANRWFYNYALGKIQKHYEETKEHISAHYNVARDLLELKKKEDTSWLKVTDAASLIYTAIHLDAAYAAFFKACKDRAKGIANDTGEPQFKRRDHHGSYTTFQKSVKALWNKNKVILPKLGEVNAVLHRKFNGKINNVTVSYNKSNQYFVSFNIEESTQLLPKKKVEYDSTIGIDLGVKNSIITSEGVKYDTLRVGSREDRRERMLHRRHSKKKKGSKNAEKARIKLAKYRNKLVNRKNAFIDKVTSDVVRNENVSAICVENLNVKGMTKNHRLAKTIQESSFNEIKRKLSYKGEWYGVTLVEVDRFFPSSKTCHKCGHINNELTLDKRQWICPHCGERLDRDINASINIKNEGYRILTEAQQ